MLKSIRNPLLVAMSDASLNEAYCAALVKRIELIRLMDNGGVDVDDELDAIDAHLFAIDDELCARDLPLPLYGDKS